MVVPNEKKYSKTCMAIVWKLEREASLEKYLALQFGSRTWLQPCVVAKYFRFGEKKGQRKR